MPPGSYQSLTMLNNRRFYWPREPGGSQSQLAPPLNVLSARLLCGGGHCGASGLHGRTQGNSLPRSRLECEYGANGTKLRDRSQHPGNLTRVGPGGRQTPWRAAFGGPKSLPDAPRTLPVQHQRLGLPGDGLGGHSSLAEVPGGTRAGGHRAAAENLRRVRAPLLDAAERPAGLPGILQSAEPETGRVSRRRYCSVAGGFFLAGRGACLS